MKSKTIISLLLAAIATGNSAASDIAPVSIANNNGEYRLVWSDEFNTPDGSLPDFETNWVYAIRDTPDWKKFNSPYDELYRINDGCLTLKAMANPGLEDDDSPFLTGAIQSSGKFNFTYGLIEARIKTTRHTGNFPAFWMMPEDRINGGWPYCGEIDIWEQINDENRSYHTLHAYWTKNSGGKSANIALDMDEFHVYGLEWDYDGMKWYVDGKCVFTFKRSQYGNPKDYVYPFDAPFYIILDQAVGNGNSWAQHYDPEFEYATYIDYVRVFQKEGQYNSNLPKPVNPQGIQTQFSETTGGFINNNGKPVSTSGVYPNSLWVDGDDVYIQSPVPASKFNLYAKGRKTAEGFEVQLPQYLGNVAGPDGKETEIYLNLMVLDVEETANGSYSGWYWNAPGENTVEYIKGDDDTYKLNIAGNKFHDNIRLPIYMLGLVFDLNEEDDNSWTYYADYYQLYEPIKEKPLELPQGLATEPWALFYNGFGRPVDVAVDGDDIYIGNWTDDLPDSFVKGTINNNVATFPMTYLGIAESYKAFAWFTPSELQDVYDETWDMEFEQNVAVENYSFRYYPTARKLMPMKDYSSIFISTPPTVGKKVPGYLENYLMPIISWQDPAKTDAAPAEPCFIGIYDFTEWLGTYRVEFDLPCINVKGNLLDTDKMYYIFYLDGKPFTFTPEEYPGIEEDLTEIPYNFTDKVSYDIYAALSNHQITLYHGGFSTVGVQTFFKADDGTIYSSVLTEEKASKYLGENGLDTTIEDCGTVSVEYTDLTGRRITHPGKGLYLRTETRADGTLKTTKHLK